MGEREVRRPVAILDRDGTIIDVVRDEETGAIGVAFHPDQLRLLPGAIEGMRALAGAGYRLAIATNQPGPAKGQYSKEAVLRTNAALVAMLAGHGLTISSVKACMHHPQGGPGGDPALVGPCDCRKPRAGLLRDVLAELGAPAQGAWMIGDSESDVRAGREAGTRTGLVFARNRCELCPLRPRSGSEVPPRAVVPDVHGSTLAEVAEAILAFKC
jgi:D-glycero-D-manno-heptose 1,7-bisphosphate phosphatase